MARIMKNDGNIVPKVVTILPRIPLSLYPMKIEMLTARMPGVDWEIASKSMKSSLAFPFIYNLFFYQWHHSIAASYSKESYLRKEAECLEVNIHVIISSYHYYLLLSVSHIGLG